MRDFISDQLNKPMTRKQFLQMSASLVLALVGVQNLMQVLVKHTSAPTSPVSLLAGNGNGFGSRKFGE